MQRFFQQPIPGTQPIAIGASSLVGSFKCSYCLEPHAQLDRFQLLVLGDSIIGKGSFCTPECAAAWNRYKSRAHNNIDAQHQLLVRRHGRAIYLAPPPSALREWPRERWLPECRAMLANEADREIAARELVVERLDLERVSK
jgi:hypothetical protein